MLKHPNGKVIRLHKKYHSYYVYKEKYNFISVTQFLNKYFPKFKKEEIAKRYAEKHGLNWKAVAAEWTILGEDSSERGDKYHEFSEEVYKIFKAGKYDGVFKGIGTDYIEKRMEKILLNLYNKYNPIPPESIVGSFKYGIAGSIDLLMVSNVFNLNKNKLLIADWKFVKEIKMDNPYKEDTKGFYPIQHLDNCNYNKYALQLNLYSFIIKTEGYFPNYPNHELYVFHVTDDDIIDIKIPDMQNEIKNMVLDYRRDK